ncbi:hypothetical protein [Terrabacter sp. C0L_2]|uniref:hypothetical protein n=1 Tax=Terrabacter sp. C0L_2 TaxID=3108389 RepID=UPI002ED631F0|nr:hypothetical protein U5C87_08040 [Terrabacter sp. C0L_2]
MTSNLDTRQQPSVSTQSVPALVVVFLGSAAVVAGSLSVVGTDALWLPAMGDRILQDGAIPRGIPFAAAPSADWINTTALGQVILSGAYTLGSLGVVAANVVAVTATLSALALTAGRRGAAPMATSLTVLTVALGAAAPLLIARAQLLSLVPFVLLLALLRREHHRPSRAIWWTVPLLALWSNLHGAVLVGVAVTGCYLCLSRLRVTPATAIAVGLASVVATCLNPGLWSAPSYYLGVLGGEATTDESGMWGPVTLTNPFDVVLVIAAVALGVSALRKGLTLWELAATVGLVVATGLAARNGIWLLLFLAVPAATAFARRRSQPPTTARLSQSLPIALALAFLLIVSVVLALRAPGFRAADGEASRIAAATSGQVVLTVEPLAESLAAVGATVWASNPLDAFAQHDQATYLAFLRGDAAGARDALESADVVVAVPGSAQARLALGSGFSRSGTIGSYTVFRRA